MKVRASGWLGPAHRPYFEDIRKNLEGSFNDVILAGATAGFRALLLSRGEELDVIRTLVPVSVRPRDDKGMAVGDGTMDNQVSAMFAELPVGIEDPVERLHSISAQMAGLKESKRRAVRPLQRLRSADCRGLDGCSGRR